MNETLNSLAVCHTALKFLSWDVVMKYFQLLLPLPFWMWNCQKLPKASLVVRGLRLINQSSCWCGVDFVQSSSLPDWTSHSLLLINQYEDLHWMESAKSWTWAAVLSKDIHSCVKTSRILTHTSEICRDNQQREEAIELRQAPKSVKPCYPKGKNQCSPFRVGMLLCTVLTPCTSLCSSEARLTFNKSGQQGCVYINCSSKAPEINLNASS